MPDTDNPGRTFYFWFDAETSGLDPYATTVLEVGWCFTNEALELLTPLRQRFAKVQSPPSSRSAHSRFYTIGYPVDPSDDSSWHEDMPELVRNMHTDSGLRTEWIKTATAHPHRLIDHAHGLLYLVREDLDRIGFTTSDRLVLAGAGVSHFDDSVLAEVFAEFYPRRPILPGGEQWPARWHYRCFDTSVAVMVAGAREAIDELAAQLAKPVDSGDEILPFSLVACEVGPEQDETDRLVINSKRGNGEVDEFVRDYAVAHRAADDVTCSLLDARALRYLVGAR